MTRHKRVSIIVFYDVDGRILLQDRFGISKVGEAWWFFGGTTEPGETPEQTLRREIKEELGVRLNHFDFLCSCKVLLVGGASYNEASIYIMPLGDLFLRFKQAEGRGMRFFTCEEARQLRLPRTDIDVVKRIEDYFRSKKKIDDA